MIVIVLVATGVVVVILLAVVVVMLVRVLLAVYAGIGTNTGQYFFDLDEQDTMACLQQTMNISAIFREDLCTFRCCNRPQMRTLHTRLCELIAQANNSAHAQHETSGFRDLLGTACVSRAGYPDKQTLFQVMSLPTLCTVTMNMPLHCKSRA